MEGSKATDEYKSGLYYKKMREWTKSENITCFYFEAFDEPWKDASNLGGSENHFGLFTVNGEAKYAIWNFVDDDKFDGLMRAGNKIEKTNKGNIQSLIDKSPEPPAIAKVDSIN